LPDGNDVHQWFIQRRNGNLIIAGWPSYRTNPKPALVHFQPQLEWIRFAAILETGLQVDLSKLIPCGLTDPRPLQELQGRLSFSFSRES
jgi:hypothetical protein